MAYRRISPGVFSMSMLDTVTCGLGGAIVLLLYMASIVPPQAKLLFEELVPADQPEAEDAKNPADPAAALPIPRGILTLVFTVTDGSGFTLEAAESIGVGDCARSGASDVPGVIFSTAHTPKGLYQAVDKTVGALSVSLWLEPDIPLPMCLRITPPEPIRGICQYGIITDGYATIATPKPCTETLEFKRDDMDPTVRTFEVRE